MPGRSEEGRKRDNEKKNKCSRCRVKGHYVLNCPTYPTTTQSSSASNPNPNHLFSVHPDESQPSEKLATYQETEVFIEPEESKHPQSSTSLPQPPNNPDQSVDHDVTQPMEEFVTHFEDNDYTEVYACTPHDDPSNDSWEDPDLVANHPEKEEEEEYYASFHERNAFPSFKQFKPDEHVKQSSNDETPLPPRNPNETLFKYMDRVLTEENQKRAWTYFWDNYVCSSCGKQERHRESNCPHVCYLCRSTGSY